jgi:hypothetical protein
MPHDAFATFVQVVFGTIFFLTICAGFLLVVNRDKWFGIDPNMPSENGSSRAYSKIQVFIVWMHVFLLSGAFLFMLH